MKNAYISTLSLWAGVCCAVCCRHHTTGRGPTPVGIVPKSYTLHPTNPAIQYIIYASLISHNYVTTAIRRRKKGEIVFTLFQQPAENNTNNNPEKSIDGKAK